MVIFVQDDSIQFATSSILSSISSEPVFGLNADLNNLSDQIILKCKYLDIFYNNIYPPVAETREVKAGIPCSSGAGRRGFNPRQLRRTKHAFFPPLAI